MGLLSLECNMSFVNDNIFKCFSPQILESTWAAVATWIAPPFPLQQLQSEGTSLPCLRSTLQGLHQSPTTAATTVVTAAIVEARLQAAHHQIT